MGRERLCDGRGLSGAHAAPGLGALCCALALGAAVWAPADALRGWLAASLFWTALPIGGVGLLMMMRVIPGSWNIELMVFAEGASLLAPLGALTMLPILIGAPLLYPWGHAPPHGAFQAVYLTQAFFVLRSLLWFGVLGGLACLLIMRRPWSTPVSCAGLVLFALASLPIYVDWVMSLDPAFHASGFSLYVLSVQMTIAIALLALASLNAASERHCVIGALLLTALLIWGYLLFMQYFISWSSNLPGPAAWYRARGLGIWGVCEWLLALPQLAACALLLLSPYRRSRRGVITLAATALIGKFIECAWLVLPGSGSVGVSVSICVLSNVGLGLIYAALFRRTILLRIARRAPLRGKAVA